MKPQKAVMKETKHIAVGTFALVAVMLVVFALLGRFDASVLFGGVYAGIVAVGNFFILGLTVQGAVGGIQGEDEAAAKRARAKMQLSYSARMLGIFGLMALALAVLKLDPLATLLPLLFPRIAILIAQCLNKARSKGSEDQ